MNRVRLIDFNNCLKKGLELISQKIGYDAAIAVSYLGLNSDSKLIAGLALDQLKLIDEKKLDDLLVGDQIVSMWSELLKKFKSGGEDEDEKKEKKDNDDQEFLLYLDVFKDEFNSDDTFKKDVKKLISDLKDKAKLVKI
jgi:hypothetical protein